MEQKLINYVNNLSGAGISIDAATLEQLYNALPDIVRDNASVILLPVAAASGVVYGMDNEDGALVPFTFSRATGATLFDTDKNIQLVSNNIPRLDYGNYSDSAKLLIEKETINYIGDNDFKLGLNIVGGLYTLIDYDWKETVLANKSAQLSSDLGATSYYYKRPGNLPIDTILSFSLYYQNDENKEFINLSGSGGDGTFNVSDLQSASLINQNLIKEGIYRVSRYGLNTNSNAWFGIAKVNNTLTRKSYVVGYQIEEGNTMTSYIPTSGSQVTRSADLLSINLHNAATVYLKTTKQETTLDKPAGLWSINEDLNNEGIEYIAVLNAGVKNVAVNKTAAAETEAAHIENVAVNKGLAQDVEPVHIKTVILDKSAAGMNYGTFL